MFDCILGVQDSKQISKGQIAARIFFDTSWGKIISPGSADHQTPDNCTCSKYSY